MTVKLKVRNVSKLFNDKQGEGLARLKRGETKDEIFAETGVTVGINDVSFDVNEGEIFVIMGLSGSGKSTLVRTLNRLIDPTLGEIWIGDDEVASCSKSRLRELRRRKISMVFQHFALLPHKTVAENTAFGLMIKGVGKEERRKAAVDALAKVGLEQHADSYPGQLSGGMQQRVGLARGLANDPEILLMDEPFGALDPLIRREVQEELLNLQRDLKKTIIFITHDLNEAFLLGDRIAIMKDGAFVQVGTAQEIVSEPADEYVRAFMADIDRSRVFTASDAANEAVNVKITDSVGDALAAMDDIHADSVLVVDGGGFLKGVVTREAALAAKPKAPLRAIMNPDTTSVGEGAYLNELYGVAQSGDPVAVTDDDGKLVGVVEVQDILSHLAPDEYEEEGDAQSDDTDEPEGSSAANTADEGAQDDRSQK